MLKKFMIVTFAILALATFSACDDGEGDEGAKGPDTNTGALDGACREDGTCDSGLACNTYTKICMKVFVACELGCSDGFECKENECVEVKPPAPDCAVDADCGSDKLCNDGKCEDIGGEEGGDEDGGNGGGDSGDGSGDGGSGGGKIVTFQNAQGLLLGNIKYALPLPITFPDANLKKAVIDTLKIADASFNKTEVTIDDCKKLTSLNVSNKNISTLEGLQFCTKLTSLYLWGNKLCDSGSPCAANMNVIAGFTNLTSLDLGSNNISDISALKNLTNLTSLYLWNNNISDISALKGLAKLTGLNLGNNKLCDSTTLCSKNMNVIAGLTDLTWLYLDSNNIGDISTLKGLTELTWLELSNNIISDISALKTLTKLTTLYLSSNKLCDSAPSCTANMNVIANLTDLTWLSLSGNNLCSSGSLCAANMNVIAGLTDLTWLDLQDNDISDISALKDLTKLTTLGLSYNKDIHNIDSLVINANNGGFSEDGSEIYLNGIPITYKIDSSIKTLKDMGITVHDDKNK